MLDHVSITVPNLDVAEPFYDAIMFALGFPKVRRDSEGIGYGERCRADRPDLNYLSVKLDNEVKPAGTRHWCFKSPSRAAVDAFWKAGTDNGGKDDGPPGLRTAYHPTYYAAFLIDPAGNRIEAVCHLAEDGGKT